MFGVLLMRITCCIKKSSNSKDLKKNNIFKSKKIYDIKKLSLHTFSETWVIFLIKSCCSGFFTGRPSVYVQLRGGIRTLPWWKSSGISRCVRNFFRVLHSSRIGKSSSCWTDYGGKQGIQSIKKKKGLKLINFYAVGGLERVFLALRF